MTQDSEVILAEPRGFCAGVDRAIDIVERALELHGAPIYVRHEIVHNKFVVENLRDKGAIFIDELDQAPAGAIVVFSAHGVSRAVRAEAQLRDLRIFDATCPLVTKVHIEVAKMHAAGLEIVMIGHKGHPEVEGTLGQAVGRMHLVETPEDVAALEVDNPENTAFVTQTTLSIDDAKRVADALRAKFPGIVEPKKSDICYATQNRQDAVKVLAPECDVFFVVGSVNSSNSNRLREVAERLNCAAYLIDNAQAIQPEWLQGAGKIGITAGASAPEVLVQEVVERLKELGAISVRRMDGTKENVTFPLPKELSRKQQAGR
ncbi:4-hydroxy-3-methylbut-2-enyl diphosphate reductase [Advenella mimigardefordensis]|uniref:4-hydroxy-3-methylbut-2-enyl diphosphate reductase n=1 Tax=Advenella mimigardefordensis (strain DSM 17166 / LMG 22922 / DPN7) TaxID=1247726 RepID=W0PFZ2_ADVMD|nr:4-hydroxy-3-methylbut-2-enyl diphosphate reductase [Advenella mimigardefordensis]AHG64412.1 4-hydroxy-3-methylbut-2-enyl diphosphate reductase [Advenella mimigardefordensis DPN7]